MKTTEMPDKIWVKPESVYMEEDGTISTIPNRWYKHNSPITNNVPYLRSTPAREHAEEIRNWFKSFIDKCATKHYEPKAPRHYCGLHGFGQLGDYCPACEPKEWEKWKEKRKLVLDKLEKQPINIRIAIQLLATIEAEEQQ